MKTILFVFALVFALSVPALAQQNRVMSWEHPVTITTAAGTTTYTPAQVQAWTAVLDVNGTLFVVSAPSCSLAGSIILCTSVAPPFDSALTPTGTQVFKLTLKDALLGDGPVSAPFLASRPGASSNLKFK